MTPFNNDLDNLLKKHNITIEDAKKTLEVGLKNLELEAMYEKLKQDIKSKHQNQQLMMWCLTVHIY